ncbi:hypothetical protein [Eisenbergiella sp.]
MAGSLSEEVQCGQEKSAVIGDKCEKLPEDVGKRKNFLGGYTKAWKKTIFSGKNRRIQL